MSETKLLCIAVFLTTITIHLSGQCLKVISCPQTQQVYCDNSSNDPLLWNQQPYTFSNITGSADLYEGSFDLNLRARFCPDSGAVSITYTMFLDLDQDDLFETVVQSANPPPPGLVWANNAFSQSYDEGDSLWFDQRQVPDSSRYKFTLQVVYAPDDTIIGRVRWTTTALPGMYVLPRIPEGKHRIIWYLKQGYSSASCELVFRVKDCAPPTITCKTNTTIPIQPSIETAAIATHNLVDYLFDNITPNAEIPLSARLYGTGSGYPEDSLGNPIDSLYFDCSHIGVDSVEVWAIDYLGNTASCVAKITVQSYLGSCADPLPIIQTEFMANAVNLLDPATYHIEWPLPQGGGTQSYSLYQPNAFIAWLDSIPDAPGFTLKVSTNKIPQGALTTFDLVLMNKHILQTDTFTEAHQYIAADFNNSKSVSTFDVVQFRRRLLGLTPIDSSDQYRFFIADCVQDPNPFLYPDCPSFYSFDSAGIHEFPSLILFETVITGDVNNSGTVFAAPNDTDNRSGALYLIPEPAHIEVGEWFDIPIHVKSSHELAAIQAAFLYDHTAADITEIAASFPDFSEDCYAVLPEVINLAWAGYQNYGLSPEQPAFRIKGRAKKSFFTQDLLKITSNPALMPQYYTEFGDAGVLILGDCATH